MYIHLSAIVLSLYIPALFTQIHIHMYTYYLKNLALFKRGGEGVWLILIFALILWQKILIFVVNFHIFGCLLLLNMLSIFISVYCTLLPPIY